MTINTAYSINKIGVYLHNFISRIVLFYFIINEKMNYEKLQILCFAKKEIISS